MTQLFRNNAYGALGASLSDVATTLTVATGQGDRFPGVTAPDFFMLTLQDASNNIEVVKVTARTAGADTMTIVRAQEGTSARSWNIGDVVELRLTASALAPLGLLEGDATPAGIRTKIGAVGLTGNETIDGNKTFSGSTTFSGASVAFSAAGARITGDFSTTTIANRVMFQTSVANSPTVVSAIPNGTSPIGQFNAHNQADPTNSSGAQMLANATEVSFRSAQFGSGTLLPMTFYTGGFERVRINASGQFAIGGAPNGNAASQVYQTSSTYGLEIFAATSGTNSGKASIRLINAGNTVERLVLDAESDTLSKIVAVSSLALNTGGSERMRIEANGNINFTGTGQRITGDFSNATFSSRLSFQTSTANSFTVLQALPNGSGNNAAFTAYESSDPTNSANLSLAARGDVSEARISAGTAGTGPFRPMTFYTGRSERMRIGTNGNVSIGTTDTSQYSLSVPNATSRIGTTLISNQGSIEVGQLGSGDRPSFVDFHSSGLPGALDFSARVLRNSGANGSFEVANTGTGSLDLTQTGLSPIRFISSGAERARVGTDGDFYVGFATNGGSNIGGLMKARAYNCKPGSAGALTASVFNIDWTGTAQLWIDATKVGTITLTSDYRIKKNVETQTASGLDRIKRLRPVIYEHTDYGTLFKADGVQREGFIAHEVQEVIPSGVSGQKDAEDQIQSLRIDAIVSVMVKAMQEQQDIIDQLKTRIEALEAGNV